MRENAVRNVTYIVVMCAKMRYNSLNVRNCAQKCGKKLSFAVSGCSETKQNPAKCAQKCGKKLSFAVSGCSETKRNPANYAEKCGASERKRYAI